MAHPTGSGLQQDALQMATAPSIRFRQQTPWLAPLLKAASTPPSRQAAPSCAELATAVAYRRKTREIPKDRIPNVIESARKPQAAASIWGSEIGTLVCAHFQFGHLQKTIESTKLKYDDISSGAAVLPDGLRVSPDNAKRTEFETGGATRRLQSSPPRASAGCSL